MPWALRGLRNGVLTTRYPSRPDPYGQAWRGGVAFRGDAAGVAHPPAAQLGCPTGALRDGPAGLELDRGRCILCGRCVQAAPDLLEWRAGAEVAELRRDELRIPAPGAQGAELEAVRADLAERVSALGRSVHLRHVDAGSDGSEEWELAALWNPVYDAHRLGIYLTASPRHADVLIVTGAGAHGMAEPVRATYEAMPRPRVVMALGTDAVSGGLVAPGYAVAGGVADLVPVDVWVPGSPPSPLSILHGLLLALGRLPQRRGGAR